MSKIGGGSAYPCAAPIQQDGITILDYFAAAALPKMMSYYNDYDLIANKCYAVASAMLRRKKAIAHSYGRDGSDPDLCDVHYWKKRADQFESEVSRLTSELKDREGGGYVRDIERKGEL